MRALCGETVPFGTAPLCWKNWAQRAQEVAQGALGWYETEQALQAAHPTGQNGQWAIVGTTDTIWTWDSDTNAWVDSGSQMDLSQYYTKTEANAAFATAAQGALAASAVQSVNGKTGTAVTLAATDVGAAPALQYSTSVPAPTGRKWIDGKDIYAIAIQGTTGAVITGTYFQLPVSIDTVVSMQGFIQLSGARFWPFPGGVDGPASSHTAIQVIVTGSGAAAKQNTLYLNVGNSIFASMPFVAILEYTEAST